MNLPSHTYLKGWILNRFQKLADQEELAFTYPDPSSQVGAGADALLEPNTISKLTKNKNTGKTMQYKLEILSISSRFKPCFSTVEYI